MSLAVKALRGAVWTIGLSTIRIEVLIRSTAILGILIFPMGVGLGIIADTLARVLLPEYWYGVAPF